MPRLLSSQRLSRRQRSLLLQIRSYNTVWRWPQIKALAHYVVDASFATMDCEVVFDRLFGGTLAVLGWFGAAAVGDGRSFLSRLHARPSIGKPRWMLIALAAESGTQE